jgi:hypothetical protein
VREQDHDVDGDGGDPLNMCGNGNTTLMEIAEILSTCDGNGTTTLMEMAEILSTSHSVTITLAVGSSGSISKYVFAR